MEIYQKLPLVELMVSLKGLGRIPLVMFSGRSESLWILESDFQGGDGAMIEFLNSWVFSDILKLYLEDAHIL